MKKRRGSTLVLTIMVLVVLMILSTALLNVMVTNSKQAVMHRNKIQAYYIARSGAEIAEAAIMKMDEDQIEELETNLDNGNTDIKIENQLTFEEGELVSVVVAKEGFNLKITSKAIVASSQETVEKIMGKNHIHDGNDSGGYRGVMPEHDNINYLGSKPEKPDKYHKDGEEFIKIGNIEYKIIKTAKKLEEGLKGDNLNRNYYLDFNLEKEFGRLDIKDANIYTTSEFKLNADSINMKNSSIISEKEILIKTEKKYGVSIDNSTIISYGDIEINAEETNENIDIIKTVIKSKNKLKIITKNKDINIDDTTIVSGPKENEGNIIIEVKNDSIRIEDSAIRAGEEIEIKGKEGNGVTNSIKSSIISKKIKIERDNNKIELSGSKLVGKEIEDEENIDEKSIEKIAPYIKGDKDFYELPGMPRRSVSSEKGQKDSIYKPGYYKKED